MDNAPTVEELLHLLTTPTYAPEPPPKANPNLSQTQFFHGTNREMAVGDEVLPWQELRARGIVEGEGLQNTDRAWAAYTPEEAKRWIGRSPLHRGGSPHVYPVEHIDEEGGPTINHHTDLGVSSSRGFRVTGPEVEDTNVRY